MTFDEYYVSIGEECLSKIPFKDENGKGCDIDNPITLPLIASNFFLARVPDEAQELIQVASPFGFFRTKKTSKLFVEYNGGMTIMYFSEDLDSKWREPNGSIPSPPLLKAEVSENGTRTPLWFSSYSRNEKDALSYSVLLPSDPHTIKVEKEKVCFYCDETLFCLDIDSLKCKKNSILIYVPGLNGFFSSEAARVFSF